MIHIPDGYTDTLQITLTGGPDEKPLFAKIVAKHPGDRPASLGGYIVMSVGITVDEYINQYKPGWRMLSYRGIKPVTWESILGTKRS